MRCFLTLLRREVREARNIALVFAFFAPLALVAYEELGAHYTYPLETARWGIPVIVALVVATLTADIVAADVATRRIDALAALPVRLGTIWSAKVSFVVLATLAAYALLLATSLVQYELRAPSQTLPVFHDALIDWWFCSLAAIPVAFGVLAFSTALQRGFAAGLAGVLAVGSAAAMAVVFDYRHYELTRVMDEVRVAVPLIVAALLLIGSYVAFTRGPVHAGSTLRRATFAAILPLCVVVAGATIAYAGVESRIDFAPGDRAVALRSLDLSPDGRHLALVASRPGQRRSRVWVVNMESGRVADIPGAYTRCGLDAWCDDGSLQVWEHGFDLGDCPWPTELELVRWVDPDTGEIRRTRSREQFLAEGGRVRRDGAWATPKREWYADHLRHRQIKDGFERLLSWQGVEHVLASNTQFADEPGWIVSPTAGGDIVWRNVGTGEERARVETLDHAELWRFRDADTLLVVDGRQESRRVRVFARDDGRPIGGPWDWPEETSTTLRLGQVALNGWLILTGEQPALWNPESGVRIALDDVRDDELARFTGWTNSVCLPDGRLAIALGGGIRVYNTADGTLERTYIRDVD